jgi:mono/diheme cytochrome c family protein
MWSSRDRARTAWFAGFVVLATGALWSCGTGLGTRRAELPIRGGSGAAGQAPVFNRDIAPILYRHCAACHRPEGPGPFSLLAYEEVKAVAPLVLAAIESRRMPPWLPEPGYAEFQGERRLSGEEIATIRRWVEAGTPRGDPADQPTAPPGVEGWVLGEPDAIVEFPSYTVPARGPDIYRNFVAPAPVSELKYVKTVHIRPGDPKVVHHARMMVDSTESSRLYDAQDPEPGFDGMHITSNALNPEGFFVGWTPGRVPLPGADDMAWPLRPGSDIVLQLHLRPAGEPYRVKPVVGLYFASRPPTRHPVVIMMGTKLIDIPPGEKQYIVRDSFELPVDVEVLGVYPHAHFLARQMHAQARLPGGRVRWLLRIDDWDFNWQDEYRYAKPIPLPKGTVLLMRYRYDNSSDNPRNPNNPPKRVTFGSSSTDEMADLVLQLLPKSKEEAEILERRVNWKRHADEIVFLASRESALGDSALAAGDADRAIEHYRQALLLKPDALSHYALGRALALKGETPLAVMQLEQALRLAAESGNTALAQEIERLLDRYKKPRS